jgi:hypothetical protein
MVKTQFSIPLNWRVICIKDYVYYCSPVTQAVLRGSCHLAGNVTTRTTAVGRWQELLL